MMTVAIVKRKLKPGKLMMILEKLGITQLDLEHPRKCILH
jgi:hypothetical protein